MSALGRSETHAVPISTTAIAAEQSFIAGKRETVPTRSSRRAALKRPIEFALTFLSSAATEGSSLERRVGRH